MKTEINSAIIVAVTNNNMLQCTEINKRNKKFNVVIPTYILKSDVVLLNKQKSNAFIRIQFDLNFNLQIVRYNSE